MRHRRIDGVFRFLKRDDAIGPEVRDEVFERVAWVCHIHQHEPADERVKIVGKFQFACVASDKFDVRETCCLGALTCRFQNLSIDIYADDASLFSDKFGEDECYIACAAADLQHFHAVCDARRFQQPLR